MQIPDGCRLCTLTPVAMQAYHVLVAKHSQLAQEHRKALEDMGDAALSSDAEQLLAVRTQLADLMPRYDAACDAVAELRCVWAGAQASG
jgi:hypothetical protein